MKMVGVILVMAGCIGYAYQYMERIRHRILCLKGWGDIMEGMVGEIRYGRTSLPECFVRLGRQYSSLLGQCILQVGLTMEEHPEKNLEREMKEMMHGHLDKLFTTEEIEDYFLFPCFEGNQDEMMQREILDRNRETVKEALAAMKADYLGKRKMVYSIGVMAGVVLVLLLI